MIIERVSGAGAVEMFDSPEPIKYNAHSIQTGL